MGGRLFERVRGGEGYEYNYAFTIHLPFSSSQDFSKRKLLSNLVRKKIRIIRDYSLDVSKMRNLLYTNNTKEEEEDYPTEPDRFDSFSLDGWTTQLNRAGARVCACVCRVFAGGRGSRLLSRVEW